MANARADKTSARATVRARSIERTIDRSVGQLSNSARDLALAPRATTNAI